MLSQQDLEGFVSIWVKKRRRCWMEGLSVFGTQTEVPIFVAWSPKKIIQTLNYSEQSQLKSTLSSQ